MALCLSRFERGVVYFYVALVFPEGEGCVEDVPCSCCELGDGGEGAFCGRGEGGCRAAEFDGCHDYLHHLHRMADALSIKFQYIQITH